MTSGGGWVQPVSSGQPAAAVVAAPAAAPPVQAIISSTPTNVAALAATAASGHVMAAYGPNGPTAQQLQHQIAVERMRSEEARAAHERNQRIMEAGAQIEQAKKFTKQAYWGEVFIKHGRRGSPHERNVTLEVTGSDLKFDWSSGSLKAHKSEIQLLEGKTTPVLQRDTARKSKDYLCFSIVTKDRSLDLEAKSEQTKQQWVSGINLLLKYLK